MNPRTQPGSALTDESFLTDPPHAGPFRGASGVVLHLPRVPPGECCGPMFANLGIHLTTGQSLPKQSVFRLAP